MNLTQRRMAREADVTQRGTVSIKTVDGDTVTAHPRGARSIDVRSGVNGRPEIVTRNWSLLEAQQYVRDYQRFLLLGWLRNVPVLQRYAPTKPLASRTQVHGLRARGIVASGATNVAIRNNMIVGGDGILTVGATVTPIRFYRSY